MDEVTQHERDRDDMRELSREVNLLAKKCRFLARLISASLLALPKEQFDSIVERIGEGEFDS